MKKDTVLGVVVLVIIILIGGFYYSYNSHNSNRELLIQTISIQDSSSSPHPSTANASMQKEAEKETTSKLIKVYVTGAVVSEGVYELPNNARVEDVLSLAKPTQQADLTKINLARFLVDGEQIKVFAQGENDIKEQEIVNINIATKEQLMTLPNIGQVTAQTIIEYREANGNFTTKEQLKDVPRIGDKTYEKLEPYITVE